ncbi:MAG: HAD family phosphatase [Lachnospiraceae bacterium]|nr:HAD family phosphatase [Lachnospiraceae bacterium]
MLKNIEAVLFDLDGTLVDSMWLWKEIDVEYLGRFGIELPSGLQTDIEGMSFSETAAYMKERFQIPDSVEKMKDDWNQMAWNKYTYEVPLKEGAKEFLDYCRENGIKLGIATSNSRELVENIIRVHGLTGYFTCVVTGCEVNKGKPAPDVYLEACARCSAEPSACLVFEDIVPGILAGKAAGMKVCAVEDAYSMDQKENKQKLADYYIRNYHEISY